MKNYNPEAYWSEVANRIELRESGGGLVAGDDEPYYRYKRRLFLQMLNQIEFKDKSVLEVGCGPGGNLVEILNHQPKELCGVDISGKMLEAAKRNLPPSVTLLKSSIGSLPFGDERFDIVFSATVLQHNLDENIFIKLLAEMARVCSQKIYLFERVEKVRYQTDYCIGRPLNAFTDLLNQRGYTLIHAENISIKVSYIMAGMVRKLFNHRSRAEGEALSGITVKLEHLLLPLTSRLDRLMKWKSDLTKMEFVKVN